MTPDTLGARRIFLLLFAAEIERRSRDREEREKKPFFFRSLRSRRSVCVLIRARDHTCGSTTFFSKDFTQNILKINEAIVVLRSLRYI